MKSKTTNSMNRRSFVVDLSQTLFFSALSVSILPVVFLSSCDGGPIGDNCDSTDDCDPLYNCMNSFNCQSFIEFDCDDYFDCLKTFTCNFENSYGGFICHDYYFCSGGHFTCVKYDEFDCDDFTCVAPYACNKASGTHSCSMLGTYSHKGGKGS